jgi:hypothetical protein
MGLQAHRFVRRWLFIGLPDSDLPMTISVDAGPSLPIGRGTGQQWPGDSCPGLDVTTGMATVPWPTYDQALPRCVILCGYVLPAGAKTGEILNHVVRYPNPLGLKLDGCPEFHS